MSEDRILAELLGMRGELAALKTSQAAKVAQLDVVKIGQDRTRGEIMARIDRLADQVNALREDAVVAFGAAEQVRRNNERIRDDLSAWQDMVGTMQKRLMALDARVAALEGKM